MVMDSGRRVRVREGVERSGLGLRLGFGMGVAMGALVSGFLLTRAGRRVVADTFRGRRSSPLADRVLDRLWADAVLKRRRLDVIEPREGVVVITGSVASDAERGRAVDLARGVSGVVETEDRLVLEPTIRRRWVHRTRSESGAA